jgi:hypothetical protein
MEKVVGGSGFAPDSDKNAEYILTAIRRNGTATVIVAIYACDCVPIQFKT